MKKPSLNIISIDNQQHTMPVINRHARKQEMQAVMERLWHQNPQQFDPNRDGIARQRVAQTRETIKSHMDLSGKRAVDLGCGAGVITRQIRDLGAHVDAIDIATNALARLKMGDMDNITPVHDCLPTTNLDDDTYDLVICTEVIAYLKPNEYRPFFSELSRLVKSDGSVVCSTDLDSYTLDPLDHFANLAETEFIIDQWVLSHHFLLVRLLSFFQSPDLFRKASLDPHLRQQEKERRTTISRGWFMLNTTRAMGLLWKGVSIFSNPIVSFLRQNKMLMNQLERLSRFLWSESGVTNALFIGKRRPLSFPLPTTEEPKEMKHKRQVWE